MVTGDSNGAFGRRALEFLSRHVPVPACQDPAGQAASDAPRSDIQEGPPPQ